MAIFKYGELAIPLISFTDGPGALRMGSRQGSREPAETQRLFAEAQFAFADSSRVIAEDLGHSTKEKRYYCIGRVDQGVMTVRFTYRDGVIRIIGAGYWRKGKSIYDRENKVHE